MTTCLDDSLVDKSRSTISGVTVRPLACHRDDRGWLIELFRCDELSDANRPAMAYVSQTMPGVVRGPHEHVDQSDLFAFLGPGDFELHLWDRREGSPTEEEYQRICAGVTNPLAVIVPPGVVHAYKNVSDRPGWVFNAPNRLYAGVGKGGAVDQIRWEERPDCPYRVD